MIKKKRDHGLLYKAGTHPLRKEIMSILSQGSNCRDEICRIMCLDERKLKFHLDMLVQVGLVEEKDRSYTLSDDGIGFLKQQ